MLLSSGMSELWTISASKNGWLAVKDSNLMHKLLWSVYNYCWMLPLGFGVKIEPYLSHSLIEMWRHLTALSKGCDPPSWSIFVHFQHLIWRCWSPKINCLAVSDHRYQCSSNLDSTIGGWIFLCFVCLSIGFLGLLIWFIFFTFLDKIHFASSNTTHFIKFTS